MLHFYPVHKISYMDYPGDESAAYDCSSDFNCLSYDTAKLFHDDFILLPIF
jgi:hypothetical protein